MKWTDENIDKLISSADYSLETGLKRTLLASIRPVREISLDELKDKVGKSTGESTRERHVRERHVPVSGLESTEAMNNDRAMVPGGGRR